MKNYLSRQAMNVQSYEKTTLFRWISEKSKTKGASRIEAATRGVM